MATEAASLSDSEAAAEARPAVPSEPAETRVPYAPSWVDWLIERIERAPGPTWLAYAAIAAATVTGSVLLVAESGDTDTMVTNAFWGLVLPLALWLVHYLAGVAGDAFDTFRPLMDVTDEEATPLRYRLTVIPRWPSLGILVFSAVFTPLYWWIDPVASAVIGMTPVGLVGRFFSETFFGAMILVLAYQSVRQLLAVDRIHKRAVRIDLFRPAPLYAFSTLTSRTAIALVLSFTVPGYVAAQQAGGAADGVFYGFGAVGVVLGLIVFVVPLLGMQRRIVAEKRRLQGEVGGRIESTMTAVHAAVDAGDLAGAGGMNGALGVLVAERDLVERLPTFPWRPGTLGAVATAILLPVGLTVATRLIERVV